MTDYQYSVGKDWVHCSAQRQATKELSENVLQNILNSKSVIKNSVSF